MPLYRQTAAKEALDALDAADRSARRRRLEAEAEIVTEKEKKETEAYAKKYSIKTSGDWIDHIRKKILKKKDTGHLLSPLSVNGVFKTNPRPKTPKKEREEPKKSTAPADHHTCKCGAPMIRQLDEHRSTKSSAIWTDWVKCTRCGEREYKPLNQEIKHE